MHADTARVNSGKKSSSSVVLVSTLQSPEYEGYLSRDRTALTVGRLSRTPAGSIVGIGMGMVPAQ